eukprot:5094948-Prymnesium_polylepis.1
MASRRPSRRASTRRWATCLFRVKGCHIRVEGATLGWMASTRRWGGARPATPRHTAPRHATRATRLGRVASSRRRLLRFRATSCVRASRRSSQSSCARLSSRGRPRTGAATHTGLPDCSVARLLDCLMV